tara:strand:- start:837 stop:2564 length:1728 start_codon:yes stop_codon:yes gene_type:complete
MRQLGSMDWLEVDIVFFLEVEYLGRVFRFSGLTMDLSDADGLSYPYIGGLQDVVIEQSMGLVGEITTQEDTVAISIVFPNQNIAKNEFNGKSLEGCTAQLGFVFFRAGKLDNTFDDRNILYKGMIVEPIYGHPDAPSGYVEFSIENQANITEQPLLRTLLGDNLYIEDVSITPNPAIGQSPPFPTLDNIVNVADIHRGKVIPWVFGDLTNVLRENNSTAAIPISPAYVVAYDSLPPKPCYYIICGHATNATQVKVYNNLGETATAPVSTFVNIDNRTYSYFSIDGTTYSWSNSVAPNDDRQVWIEWDNGAPFPNPFGQGDLVGGGDICLFILQQITDNIDYDSWNSLSDILNEYTFGGYVNDDKITPFQWLQKNIVAYLPISIVNGPHGLKPVLDLYLNGASLAPRLKITAGEEWYRTGPIISQNTPEDIINQVMVKFAPNGVTNAYTSRVSISNDKSPIPTLLFGLSPLSAISKQKFGTRRKVVTLDYVYHWKTANKIANDIIQSKSLIIKVIQYSVSIRFGYLQIGDIIELTDNDLGFAGMKAQILKKQFVDNRWVLDFKMDENPLRYGRTDV